MREKVFQGTNSITCANSVLPTFMRHSGLLKPASIANERNEIQIVDTHESSETRFNTGVAALQHQISRTLLITLLNENYAMPGLSAGTEEQIIQGMYLCKPGAEGQNDDGRRVQLLGSGTILRESLAAQVLLAAEWGIQADVWSCPSFNELAREGQDCERWNLLHPLEAPRTSFVARQLGGHAGPVVASTDYMKSYAEQIRPFIPAGRPYKVLGTDGFGRSDFRSKLREHFEINRHYIVVAALKALSEQGSVPVAKVAEAIAKYGIQADKINPLYA